MSEISISEILPTSQLHLYSDSTAHHIYQHSIAHKFPVHIFVVFGNLHCTQLHLISLHHPPLNHAIAYTRQKKLAEQSRTSTNEHPELAIEL